MSDQEAMPAMEGSTCEVDNPAPHIQTTLKDAESCPCCAGTRKDHKDTDYDDTEIHERWQCLNTNCKAIWWTVHTLAEIQVVRSATGHEWEFNGDDTPTASLYTGGIEAERESIQV